MQTLLFKRPRIEYLFSFPCKCDIAWIIIDCLCYWNFPHCHVSKIALKHQFDIFRNTLFLYKEKKKTLFDFLVIRRIRAGNFMILRMKCMSEGMCQMVVSFDLKAALTLSPLLEHVCLIKRTYSVVKGWKGLNHGTSFPEKGIYLYTNNSKSMSHCTVFLNTGQDWTY